MGWMRNSCQQAAELVSKRLDEPLGFWQALSLRLHCTVCGNCEQVGKQVEQLGDMSAELWRGDADPPDPSDQR